MIEIRRPERDEWRAAGNVTADALMFPRLTDEEWAERLPSWEEADSIAAWDGERCVGHAAGFRVDTTVPGGRRVDTSAVSRVGVLPTHTRRGLLTGMMRQLLGDARDRGTVLASLRASEAVIYGRYGFAVAGEATHVELHVASATPVHAPAAGAVRILAPDEVLDVVTEAYDRLGRWRVGTISRPDFFVARYFKDAIQGTKPSFVAVHLDEAGVVDGYVHYDVAWKELGAAEDDIGAGEMHELIATDSAVERALWAYLLGIDLVRVWEAPERPVDDPIRLAVRDRRAYRVRQQWDEQWLRVLDVDAALSARTYGRVNDAVTIAVTDPMFAGNDGTWRVDASGATRTDAAAQLAVDVSGLSAAYLGGVSWALLAAAGRVEVRDPAAVVVADALFAVAPAPFCGSFF